MAITTNDILEIGYPYLAVYSSPVFTAQTLARLKRLKYVNVWLDNEVTRYPLTANNAAAGQTPADIANQYMTPNQVSIAVLYGNEMTGEETFDLYTHEFVSQSDRWNVFKESLQGIGVSAQLIVWSVDNGNWTLSGYQIDDGAVGKRHISGD